MNQIKAYGYFFTKPNGPLERREFLIENLEDANVVVKVAGCGLCHTDLSFYSGGVKTRKEPPLVLGHEISGEVVAAGSASENWIGKKVVVPAVLPCGECDLCKSGRANICQSQKMPGNDFNGGFASHLSVPSRFLCEVPQMLDNFSLSHLSVIADAITTPYQALLRSGLKKGELAIVIGVGGIGTYMVQHARNAGATVIAVDIDDERLESAKLAGSKYTVNSRTTPGGDVKKAVRTLVKENKLPPNKWRVFETSGTCEGQNAAYSLLSFAGTIGIIGFTMEKLTIRLSNVMAFDADIFGNWGCSPSHYTNVVKKVLSGEIRIIDFIEQHPLDSINSVISKALGHQLKKRAILVP